MAEEMMKTTPPIVLLGVCERSSLVQDSIGVWKWNIAGLKQFIPSFIFPATFGTGGFVFAVFDPPSLNAMLKVRAPSGKEVGWLNLAVQPPDDADPGPLFRRDGPGVFMPNRATWTTLVFAPARPPLFAPTPGFYEFFLQDPDGEICVGGVELIQAEAVSLTPDRIAAIRADPAAAKVIWLEIKCRLCEDLIRTYAALDKVPQREADGYIWYNDLPDRFRCKCGEQDSDLSSARRNLHGLLGVTTGPSATQTAFTPLYERTALESVRLGLLQLLNSSPREELLQKYIEENPVILHTFAPERLFFKAPILATFRTDFVIVNHARELLLIEIEKTSTRLLTKGGGVASELQHAIDQVRNWIHVFKEHHLAALDAIGIPRESVSSVAGVVVAGRDSAYPPEHLRRMKGVNHGDVTVLTYDDLLGQLGSLVRTVEEL